MSVHLCRTPTLFDSAVLILRKQNNRQDNNSINPAHDPTTISRNESLPVKSKNNYIVRFKIKLYKVKLLNCLRILLKYKVIKSKII